MASVAVPRGTLAVICGAGVVTSALVGLYAISPWRYAEWVSIERDLGEGLVLPICVLTVVVAAADRTAVRSDLLWLQPHLPRARVTLAASALAMGVAGALGWLIGSTLLLGWGAATATYGGIPWLTLVGGTLWVTGATSAAALLTFIADSLWVAPVVALCWVGVFFAGRSASATIDRRDAATRTALLPFDGYAWQAWGVAGLNPHLLWLRLLGAGSWPACSLASAP